MQQSFIQNRKNLKSFVARAGIALGIASVIAMAPMSNAMAEMKYSDYFNQEDATAAGKWGDKLGKDATTYCSNRNKSIHPNNITFHTNPKNRTKVRMLFSFTCIKKSSKPK